MKIKGAIFDLDGTVLDSMYVWDGIARRYLEQKGITPRPDLEKAISTLSLRQAVDYFKKEYNTEDDFDTVLKLTHELVGGLYRNEVKAKPGVRELLLKLSKSGVRMCIATATEQKMAADALENNKILDFFDKILTCTEVGAGKDQPLIYLKALEFLGTPKDSTLVFEDSLFAMKTAKSAGFKVLAIMDSNNESSREQIEKTADFVVDSFYEAKSLFDFK